MESFEEIWNMSEIEINKRAEALEKEYEKAWLKIKQTDAQLAQSRLETDALSGLGSILLTLNTIGVISHHMNVEDNNIFREAYYPKFISLYSATVRRYLILAEKHNIAISIPVTELPPSWEEYKKSS